MKDSAKLRYGLQLMMELALPGERGPLLVQAIARRQELPEKYLHVLIGSLKAAGLLRVQRGPRGGCELARPPAQISALEIIEALEGRPQLSSEEKGLSPGARVVGELREGRLKAEREFLRGASLLDLVKRMQSLETEGLGYDI